MQHWEQDTHNKDKKNFKKNKNTQKTKNKNNTDPV